MNQVLKKCLHKLSVKEVTLSCRCMVVIKELKVAYHNRHRHRRCPSKLENPIVSHDEPQSDHDAIPPLMRIQQPWTLFLGGVEATVSSFSSILQ